MSFYCKQVFNYNKKKIYFLSRTIRMSHYQKKAVTYTLSFLYYVILLSLISVYNICIAVRSDSQFFYNLTPSILCLPSRS